MYSSNNATSGFTRENHMAVSQVGTGPAKFMYWSNAATVLGSIVLLGFWYAIGMLAGSVKRIFGLVAAVPFATLGAMAAIAKVIVYSMALILEVLVTLFIYQFVSEFLISVPDIMAGPVSSFMSPAGLWGSAALGGTIVVILTLISSLMIMGITFALLRVRKTVLQAMDEVVTKLVDKFLETNSAPKPDKGGLMPALATGAGAGAGMAMGNKLANGFNSKTSGPASPSTGKSAGKTASTNAGGTNGDPTALTAGNQALALEGGGEGGPGDPNSPALDGGPGSGGGGGDAKALPGGSGPAGALGASGQSDGPDDKGGPLQLTSGGAGSSHSDKQTALGLSNQGGLSNLGYTSDGNKVIPGEVLASSTEPSSSRGGAQGQRSAGSIPTSGGRRTVAGQTGPAQFGMGAQGAQRQQGSNQQAAPQRFSGGATPGLVPVPASEQPASPSTRPTRSAQGTPAPRQLGAGTSAPRPVAAPVSGQTPAAPGARTPARTQAARQPGAIQAATPTPRQAPAPRAQTPRTSAPAPASSPRQAPVPRPRPRPRRVADPAPQSVETPEPQQRPAGGLRRGRREKPQD
ncbi:hypothetical protein T45_09137 [Streptomyces turgidiscabies]|nr:hypothetical protein T45_09137 [Streptomyces turgidiscabies]